MSGLTLNEAKRKYPVALYSFMRVYHPVQTMADFLKDPTANPVFRYRETMSVAHAQDYLNRLQSDAAQAQDADAAAFLRHRVREAALLCRFTELRNTAVSDVQLQMYRADMVRLYGTLQAHYFNGALTCLYAMAQDKQDTEALGVLADIQWEPVQLVHPDRQTFLYYRQLLQQHMPAMFTVVPDVTEPGAAFQGALDTSGLSAAGWNLRYIPHATNVAVSRHRKTINVGEHYAPATPFRLQQVVAHEVYGHARRFNILGNAASGWEEEGLALVCEQLLATRFMYKRMLRYVALGLAWGVDGTPRDFVQTYRLITPLVQLVTGKPSAVARQIACKEVMRAFRGGNPNVPGMVLLKDKIYLENNLKVWQYLTDSILDEAAFGRLLDGIDGIPERSGQ